MLWAAGSQKRTIRDLGGWVVSKRDAVDSYFSTKPHQRLRILSELQLRLERKRLLCARPVLLVKEASAESAGRSGLNTFSRTATVMTSADWVEGVGECELANGTELQCERAMRNETTKTVRVFENGDGDVIKNEED
jgi:hypothetical protein